MNTTFYRILACAVLAGAALAALSACGAPPEPPAAPPSVAVVAALPERGSLPRIQTAFGSAAPAANGTTLVSLKVDGRVAQLFVTPGEHVNAGQPLLEFEVSAAARAAYQQAVTAVAIARDERARIVRLLGQQLATQAQREQAEKAFGDAETALAALATDYGARPTRTVTAPLDGVIIRCPEAPGAQVSSGAELVSMTRTGALLVTVGIEAAQRGAVHVGDGATLVPLSGSASSLKGEVVRIDQRVNPASRLVDVDVRPDGLVLQGEAYRADIETGRAEGWRIPTGAVLADERGTYVFQLDGRKAVRVAIEALVDDGRSTVASGDLNAQRPLVTQGNYQLVDGTLTRPPGDAR
jgi:membrane fusion protein (multidrug efflux system)